jgi:hypothetical protein
MAAFVYRCPNTRVRIQALAAEAITDDADTYQLVACVMCQQVHLVNPFTGKLLGEQQKVVLANLRLGDETLMDKRD